LTKAGFPIDTGMVDRMHAVLRTDNPVKYLLTGHSHFDHSFDTPYWAKATGAQIIGSQSTCYQAQALGVPREQCTPVYGGEMFRLSDAVTMRVVLWNHSGTHEQNGEQHDPVELRAPPKPDANGNLRGGVAEDFPNGGGNRGYLFAIKAPQSDRKVFSLFWTNSGSATDLHLDVVVDGKNHGSPLQSLSAAMRALGLDSVDVWIAGGGESVARLVVPVLRPAAYIPNHLGDFFHPFLDGFDVGPFKDPGLKKFLDSAGIALVAPVQYMDRMDLDRTGVTRVPSGAARAAFGFPEIPVTKDAAAGDGTDGARDAGADGPGESEASKIDGGRGPTDAGADEPAGGGPQQDGARPGPDDGRDAGIERPAASRAGRNAL
jgi:hypothetical protein